MKGEDRSTTSPTGLRGCRNDLEFLRRLFPEVSIGMAHGRMKEAELEETMMGFYNGKIQILLCTTIIESGLDIPGANTIVIEDCQELGLAQMYQLRGRVGRREEAAYAYFLYPEGRPLAGETLERLDAITSLNDEGAGVRPGAAGSAHPRERRFAGNLPARKRARNRRFASVLHPSLKRRSAS